MTPQFKFNIGDFVTPVVSNSLENQCKIVVVARVTEEHADHTKRYYFCSNFRLGEYTRQSYEEAELTEWKERN